MEVAWVVVGLCRLPGQPANTGRWRYSMPAVFPFLDSVSSETAGVLAPTRVLSGTLSTLSCAFNTVTIDA